MIINANMHELIYNIRMKFHDKGIFLEFSFKLKNAYLTCHIMIKILYCNLQMYVILMLYDFVQCHFSMMMHDIELNI